MIVAALTDALVAAPFAFLTGLLVGFWIGARFDLRKKDSVE